MARKKAEATDDLESKKELLENARPSRRARAAAPVLDDEEEAAPPRRDWAAGQRVTVTALSNSATSMSNMLGLRWPGLAMAYLFQSGVFSLGRFYRLIGPPGAGKTTVLNEFARWFLMHDGNYRYIFTEPKDNPPQRNAVLEHNPDWVGAIDPLTGTPLGGSRVHVQLAPSVQEWQHYLTKTVEDLQSINEGKAREADFQATMAEIQRKLANKKEREKIDYWAYPYLIGIDSLTGSTGEGTVKGILKEGFAERGFSETAMLNSTYLGALANMLQGSSIAVIGINHDKPKMDEYGNLRSNTTGGIAPKYQMAAEIEVDEVGRAQLGAEDTVRVLSLVMSNKNGFGASGTYVHVPVRYRTSPDEFGRSRLDIRFDWGTATANIFKHLEKAADNGKYPKSRLARIRAVLDYRSDKGRYSSDRLGIPDSDPVDAETFGNMVDRDEALCNELYPLLGITWAPVYRPGVRLDIQQRKCLLAEARMPDDVYDARRFPAAQEAEADDAA